MKLIIQSETHIEEFVEAFSQIFPYLKIIVENKQCEPSSKIKSATKKSEIKLKRIQITPNMAVNELEEIVLNYLNESIQVYRKSGKMWLETSVTKNWTLEEQNNQAQEMCSFNEINNT